MMMKSVMLSAALLTLPLAALAEHDEPVASIYAPSPSVRVGVGLSVGDHWAHDSHRETYVGYYPHDNCGDGYHTYRPRAHRGRSHDGHYGGHARRSRGHAGGHSGGHWGGH